MGLSCACLLGLQVRYINEIKNLHRAHFNETVDRCLYEASRKLELDEATRYLTQGPDALNGIATAVDSIMVSTDSTIIQRTHSVKAKDGSVFTLLETTASTSLSDKYFTKRNSSVYDKSHSLKEIMAKRYVYEKALLDEVIYSILYTASDRPLQQRIDFKQLDSHLKSLLASNGIEQPYHLRVMTSNGEVVYKCSDYDPTGEENAFSETLFKNDPVQQMGVLKIHFPEFHDFAMRSFWFILPSLLLTTLLLATFIATLVVVFRSKRLTEVKNDFINNMTHEFKTPISSISLAAQMLSDPTVKKTDQMINRLTTTISDETKRLRFLVEKVLQMSMYDHKSANLRMEDVDTNELIAGVIHSFSVKVEKNGGKIISDLEAYNPFIYADTMHFTNVIFNLMDNAVKYRQSDVDLELKVRTWNEDSHLLISIQDNGIGIKKEDVKRIFEKFYRVHTGNRHDVKGFGLGLAYVKKIIDGHKGTISVESELGIGTKFIIKLPVSEEC